MLATKPYSSSSSSFATTGSGPSASSAKSHVLAGVQDAYWSDDDAEDNDCPLCLEEMDLSDINFKPCPCGYQICRFCWHHIKSNLNGRCPACRREYTDEGVQFKPISQEDQKRLTQQKKQRERERKELEHLKRSHLVNVRVVQRNLVYVTGMGTQFAKEELIPTLRSGEYFGKYGKISKIVLVKRTELSGTPVVGMYITYNRREDAARAIAAVDGTASPGGESDVVRASYGTTKYCISFLRNLPCTNLNCLDLHEWGDEKDCFTKEDLSTLKHAMKDTENRPRVIIQSRTKTDEPDAPALPRTASWAQKPGPTTQASTSTSAVTPLLANSAANGRTNRNTATSSRSNAGTSSTSRSTTETTTPTSNSRTRRNERKAAAANSAASTVNRSRPSTPPSSLPPRPSAAVEAAAALPIVPQVTPVKAKVERPISPSHSRKQKSTEKVPTVSTTRPSPKRKPTIPPAAEEEIPAPPTPASPVPTSRVQDIRAESVPPLSPASTTGDSLPYTDTPPPPPGLGHPGYQLSTQARALMDDVLNRRAPGVTNVSLSPFPDFDRTLSSLGDGSFSFSLTSDPKVARSLQSDAGMGMPLLSSSPTARSFFDPFSSNSSLPSPINPHFGGSMGDSGMYPPRRPGSSSGVAASPLSSVSDLDPRMGRPSAGSSSYIGSFNPFSEGGNSRTESPVPSSSSVAEEDPLRRGSKFGFARKESAGFSGFGGSATNSPLRYADNLPLPTTPIFSTNEAVMPKSTLPPPGSWSYGGGRDMGLGAVPPPPGLLPLPDKNSPRVQYQSPQAGYANINSMPQQHQFSPYGHGLRGPTASTPNDLSINLRELLNIHERPADTMTLEQARHEQLLHQQQSMYSGQNFVDPAIMSMSMNGNYRDQGYMNAGPMQLHGPNVHNMPATPPGLDTLPPFARRQSNNIPLASPSSASNGRYYPF